MKDIFDFISLLKFARRAAANGLIFFAAVISKRKLLYFLSFIFAPITTLIFYFKTANSINLADSLQKLGPVFIKFGQALSTRPDIIGAKIASSLASLQDKLDPFSSEISKIIIEKELGKKIEDVFLNFTNEPIAAASVAQVHKAILHSGEIVAVKILRPDIMAIYKKDIELLYSLSRLCPRFFKETKRLKPKEAVAIFEKTMNFELNLKNEAAACSELYDNLSKDDDIVIPKIYWEFCTTNILTLEWIEGVSIYETKAIEEFQLNKENLAKKLAITFLNQAFRDGYFHADLHPGNILVQKNGKIALVDFGIMGRLSDKDRFSMAEVLFSFINRDYKRVAEIHKEIGFIPGDTNIMDFALACRAVGEPIIGKPISTISIGHLLESLFKITSEFGMQTQPQLILMQKTIIIVEGIGQMLDPSVNMWNLAEPWIKSWANKNISLDAKIYRLLKKVAKDLAHNL